MANNSLSGGDTGYGATSALIDAIVAGSLGSPFRVVWANGNWVIQGYYTTEHPACAKSVIAVGALNSEDDSVTLHVLPAEPESSEKIEAVSEA